MSFGDDFGFLENMNNSGAVFDVVFNTAQKARKLSEDAYNAIPHKDALTYIARGIKVDPSEFTNVTDYETRYIKEQFCYIDDESVKESVMESFRRSKQSHSLRFVYINISSRPKMARIRVLTRMIYDALLK